MSNQELELLKKIIYKLSKTKLGFPSSLLSANRDFINNEILGIKSGSIANILLNNVGDPFKESESWSLEVKDFERKVIQVIAEFLGLKQEDARGYITSGSTEANEAAIRWSRQYLNNKYQAELERISKYKNELINEINTLEQKYNTYISKNLTKDLDLDKTISNKDSNENEILLRLNTLYKSLQKQNDILNSIQTPTFVCTKDYTHYSNYKIINNMRLNILEIPYNKDGAMDISEFKKIITNHVKNNPYNPLIINCNIGTTTTGAVDDIVSTKEILNQMESPPFYTIHMDGAMYGLLLPILKPLGEIENYFKYANTLSISFHKYLGLPQPCGIALTTQKFIDKTYQNNNFKIIEYAGKIIDTTVSGSRSGFNVLLIYHTIINTLKLNKNSKKLETLVKRDLKLTKEFYEQLVNLYGKENISWNENQFNILFPKPSKELIKKYQLMVFNNLAIVCVLANVNKELINKFISDLKDDLRNNKNNTNEINNNRENDNELKFNTKKRDSG